MKAYFRSFLIIAISFWIVIKLVPGITLSGDWQTFTLVSAALFVSTFFIKPIIKLVFLPFNILTLNLMSVLITAGLLFLLSLIVPQLKISSFTFEGFVYNGIVIPRFFVTQLLTVLAAAIIITIVTTALNWISD